MERRLLNFFAVSTLFLGLYLALNSIFPPPQRQAEQQAAAAPEGVAGEQAQEEPGSPAPNAARDEATEEIRSRQPQWATLGSMDPDSGYSMLVTLCSRGAGIERVELTERDAKGKLKYRRVDVRSGYLGYLAPTPIGTGEGARVNVVGPGTPADLAISLSGGPAGLRPGDLVVAVANQAISGPTDLGLVLERTKPGEKVVIEVIRPTLPVPARSARGPAEKTELPDEASQSEPVAATDTEPTSGGEVAAAADQRLQFEAILSEHPLDLIRLASTGGEDQIAGNVNRLSCLLSLAKIGNSTILSGKREMSQLISQHNSVWNTTETPDPGSIGYRFTVPEQSVIQAGGTGTVTLERTYALAPNSYALNMSVRVLNGGSTPQELAYRLEGPNGITLEGWWYSTKISPNFSGAAARDFVYNTQAAGRQLVSGNNLLSRARKTPQDPDDFAFTSTGPDTERTVRYLGVDAQYFVAAFVPAEGQEALTGFSQAAGMIVANPSQVPDDQERAVNVSFFADSESVAIPAGGAIEDSLTLYLGPKSPELLDQYGLSPVLEYGWFAWVAKPLSWLLHGFHTLAGNYAIAIILLTLLVRGCMFPLSRRAALHAQKMQEIAPELKKIADKYKDDFEKRLKAQRELQQRVGFNPLSGCLPMFIQLPIFLGLYRALSVDIELRQAALSSHTQWASNLAGPDMLYYWGDWMWGYLSGRGIGWLGPYFNILPLIVVTLFLVQQKMFMPPATDEQTAMTQKVMTVMTMVMGIFFFKVPSGLCVYFITSSLWGIIERKLVKKMVPSTPQLALDSAALSSSEPKKATGSGDSLSLAERLRSAAGMPVDKPAPIVPPNKRKRPPKTK